MRPNKLAILKAISDGHELIDTRVTPKWSPRWKGCPSLNDPDVSSLFRAGLLETTSDHKIILTKGGQLVLAETDAAEPA